MVEQATEEKEQSGFNYEPVQEFPEVGDQYDRDVSYKTNRPSARNIGWWQLTPSQRYILILSSFATVAEAIASGSIGQLDDETIIVAGIAPYDKEAEKVGAAFSQSEGYSSIAPLHDFIYGEGLMGGVMAAYDIPKVNTNDPGSTFGTLYSALGGEPVSRALTTTNRLAPGGIYGLVSGASWTNPRDPYTADRRGKVVTTVSDALLGEPEAGASDLLREVNTNTFGEGRADFSQILQNAADSVAATAADLTLGYAAGGLAKGTFMLAVNALKSSGIGGAAAGMLGPQVSAGILKSLVLAKRVLTPNNLRHARRGAQAVGGVAAVGTVGGSVLQAVFESDEESMAALLADTTSPADRDLLMGVYYEMQHPIAYSLRNDPDSWYNQRNKRRAVTNQESKEAVSRTQYGSGETQPGSEQLRNTYSFFNPEMRAARKNTTVEEMQGAEDYGVRMYQTSKGWELR